MRCVRCSEEVDGVHLVVDWGLAQREKLSIHLNQKVSLCKESILPLPQPIPCGGCEHFVFDFAEPVACPLCGWVPGEKQGAGT